MEADKFSLILKNVNAPLAFSLSDLLTENILSDLTLVSDDQIQLQAHKFVLSACSPVLKNLLLDNPHSHPLIYLRGVKQEEFQSILHFILGRPDSTKAIWIKDLQISQLAE